MAVHNQTGAVGEDLAVAYLEKNGYAVLEKNWRFGHEEIDIIARKNNFLIIAEVKTRRTRFFGEPEEFVTRQKQKHLIKAANAYIEMKKLDMEVRFDILSVILSGTQKQVYHIENAFQPVA